MLSTKTEKSNAANNHHVSFFFGAKHDYLSTINTQNITQRPKTKNNPQNTQVAFALTLFSWIAFTLSPTSAYSRVVIGSAALPALFSFLIPIASWKVNLHEVNSKLLKETNTPTTEEKARGLTIPMPLLCSSYFFANKA